MSFDVSNNQEVATARKAWEDAKEAFNAASKDRDEKHRAYLTVFAKVLGLTEGQTLVREKSRNVKNAGREATFISLYMFVGIGFPWITVRLHNADGKPGKREATFYDWEIMRP